jgi:membrane associated rhomboid family serine protease
LCLTATTQIIVFIVELSLGGIVPMDDNPSLGPGSATLVDMGAKQPYLMRHDYEVWRFITPIFLHAGIFHIAFNLLFQLRFGKISGPPSPQTTTRLMMTVYRPHRTDR